VDTDAGGTWDGSEDWLGNNPLNPADDVNCSYPAVGIDALVPGAGAFDPANYVVAVDPGNYDGSAMRDYRYDSDGNGSLESYSASALFSFYDDTLNYLCSATFDLGSATPAFGWVSSSGALFDTFDMNLSNGETDCPPLDAVQYAAYGTTDIREVLESSAWGVGFGELQTIAPLLEADMVAAGEDWANDWEPYTFGVYFTNNGVDADELGWVQAHVDLCDVYDDASPLLEKPTAAPVPPSGLLADTYFYDDWRALAGVQPLPGTCVYGFVDTHDPAWAPVAPLIQPAFFAVALNGTRAATGDLHDVLWDSDANGTAELYYSGVTFYMYDAAFNYLCEVDFDENDLVPIGVPAWTTTGGVLYDGWEQTLRDGTSDCTMIDAATYGTDNITDVFESVPIGFAIGEMYDLETELVAQYGQMAYNQMYAPYVNALYMSLDGVNAYEYSYGSNYRMADCSNVQPGPWVEAPAATAGNVPEGLLALWNIWFVAGF
jgi:hypothetical protein